MKHIDRGKAFLRRPRVLTLLGALVVWTGFWATAAVRDVLAQTTVGRGEAGSSLQAWEALEVIIVSAYSGVRWAAGVALVVALLVVIGLRERARASSG